jgi:S-formylglutathione hydrolase FrmB
MTLQQQEWPCRALGRVKPYSLHLPAGSPPSGGWPLLVLLHGAGRTHRAVAEAPETASLIEKYPMAVIFPDGELGFYLDSPVIPESRFQSMVCELLARVRAEQPVVADPGRTGICGWSMGGFGAVHFAESFPQEVGAVASIIGLLDYPNPALPPGQTYPPAPVFGADPAFWQSVNPLTRVDRLRGLAISLIAARSAFDYTMNVAFHQRLNTLNLPHDYTELDGAHDWPTVARAFPLMLDFMATRLGTV